MMRHTLARMAARQMLVAAAIFVGTLSVAVGCRPAPTPSEQDIVEHFKYGVLGTEETVGVPYWIFRVLPIVFADKLPDRPGTGWEKLGFIQEAPDRDRPIGTTRASGSFGVELAGLNCATCHAGTLRETPSSPRQIVLGMPANGMDLQAYGRFLTAVAQDPRFTASNLIEAIE